MAANTIKKSNRKRSARRRTGSQDIQNIVVLMQENRSFDHMLGFMKGPDYAIEGLDGTEWNVLNPLDPTGQDRIHVSRSAGSTFSPDPGHKFADVNLQLFSNPNGPPPASSEPNKGFVYNYARQNDVTPDSAGNIMECYAPSTLPVLTTLAREYALCDGWFSSVPGPTWPNRFFVHAASSDGKVGNDVFHTYDMRTIFESLTDEGLTWKNYFRDFSLTTVLEYLKGPQSAGKLTSHGQFKRDARAGKLPNYSFIEPKYTSTFGRANDQHPPHEIEAGESLIAEVYSAVRTSPQWENILLVITYDEHGGFYDHVLPPKAVPPDSYVGDDGFRFDRYGVRVPALLISPYIAKGTIVHMKDRVFDHSSIPATIKKVFGLDEFLTDRDKSAETFDDIPTLSSPRTDAPLSLTRSNKLARREKALATLARDRVLLEDVVQSRSDRPMSELQSSLVEAAHRLEFGESDRIHAIRTMRRITTEFDAAVYLREVTDKHSTWHKRRRKSS